MLCKEFIIMFARQDHLPLDRIITRFSAPTTITQFQRSSLDGILIELARLVTHGVNDNIFCLSGLTESTGWVGRGGRGREGSADRSGQAIKIKKKGGGGGVQGRFGAFFLVSFLLQHTFLFSNNIHANENYWCGSLGAA